MILNSKSSSNIFLWSIDIITWVDFWWYQTNWKSGAGNVDWEPIRWICNASWSNYFLSRTTSLFDNVPKASQSITGSLAGHYIGTIMRNIHSFLHQDGFLDMSSESYMSPDRNLIKLSGIHGNRIDRATKTKIRKSICQSTKKCRRKKDTMIMLPFKSLLNGRFTADRLPYLLKSYLGF